MKKLRVDFENCYGIKSLKAEFDFSKGRACAIYAPNGAMKSSFAKTFQDIADGADSKDRIFPTRKCKRVVLDDADTEPTKESILVVRPYDETFGHSEKTSTLLVNAPLRLEYEKLQVDIDAAKDVLLKALKEQSGSKKDLEKEISSTFTSGEDQFYRALIRVKDEVISQKDSPLDSVAYDTIFDERVLTVLETKDFKTAIATYITKYNELLDASTYFKRGTFNYYNAETIAKNLAANGFFKAKHSISLNAKDKMEIATEKDLIAFIKKEKDGISSDADLKKKFAEIEKLLTKNVTLRDFEGYLANNDYLLPHLSNISQFKEEVWKSYLKARSELYLDVLDKFQAAQKRKDEIEKQAAEERTQWEEVIDIFNSRFFVPFKLSAKNRISVMLGQEPMLSLGFTFADGADTASVERADLLAVLSTGERKALYILNIIFEIEARLKAKQDTLLIVDDIADSFDYRNKYAIIQYLKDISEGDHFDQIILTHNFDFFRTVNSRFVPYPNCFMATKGEGGLLLSKAAGIQNVFVNDWKLGFFTDPKKRIACIPFIRNLIEFTRGDTDPNFLKLTSLLHWKADSATIKEGDLDSIYSGLFNLAGNHAAPSDSVIEGIDKQAKDCVKAGAGINFENKIVLSIAIRLAAEKFMVTKINDPAFVGGIKANQTTALLRRFRLDFPGEQAALRVIERVALMTPENIHLNSFMYEPILDMSDDHLRKLYADTSALA